MGAAGFEPATSSIKQYSLSNLEIDWQKFFDYMNNNYGYKRNLPYWFNLAKLYAHVLSTGNASELRSIKVTKRSHIMKILSHLSKFLGCYPHWKAIIKSYDLKWKEESQDFVLFNKVNINEMLQYVKEVRTILPNDMFNTFVFGTLTGLRANEVCKSIRLIQSGAEGYYNTELGILEHFRFKDLFLHKSKKAFISIVNEDMLRYASNANKNYDSIRSYLRNRKVKCNMAYCRKIFATYLRDNGIPTEIIDLLQGRVNSGMFARHYYRPDFNTYTSRIRQLLRPLHNEITA